MQEVFTLGYGWRDPVFSKTQETGGSQEDIKSEPLTTQESGKIAAKTDVFATHLVDSL